MIEEAVFNRRFTDKKWRLNNLYKIRDVRGQKIDFKMNWAQEQLFENLWYFNVVLKARQLGFSTFILIYLLDHALFESNQSCGVIAQSLPDAEELFRNKVKFAYDNLPEFLRKLLSCKVDSARKMEFSNGSSIVVDDSLRSGTFQKLHVSEYGKISARRPDKAQEIKSGALNTVHPTQMIFIESTAEGQGGEFYDLCMRAIKLKEKGSKLTSLDPRIHFFPWYVNPNNVLSDSDAATVCVTDKQNEYFRSLGVELSSNQKAWYIKKHEQMGDVNLMKREHPSTWQECFEASLEGAYYSEAMGMVRRTGNIKRVDYDPAYKVDTFWDIGLNDQMYIWFMQHINGRYRFIRSYGNTDQGLGHYANVLNSFGYVYGTHHFPHDGSRRQIGVEVRNTKQIAEQLGIRPIKVVPRTKNVLDDIQLTRTIIPKCDFDEVNCKEGLAGLDGYRKEWDDKRGTWKETPYHDRNSDIADAFRTFAVGYKSREEEMVEDRPAFADASDNPFA